VPRESNIRKKSFTIVAVEGRGVIGEVGLKNIRPAVAVVIGDGCNPLPARASSLNATPDVNRNVGDVPSDCSHKGSAPFHSSRHRANHHRSKFKWNTHPVMSIGRPIEPWW